MPKRKRRSPTQGLRPAESTNALRKTLSGRTKSELVDVLMQLAEADRGILRQLTARFDVVVTPVELIAATRQAIVDATHFDVRQINRNFDYDYAAYAEVKRNLGRLIVAGQWRPAMELSLELMKRGSYQAEMSDEGLMIQDIEDCLSIVLESMAKCDLPAHKVVAWCSAMLKTDRIQCIARDELQSHRSHFQNIAAYQHRPER